MSGIDEYLVHNYPHPVRVMWTADLQAYERVWFTTQDTEGELLLVVGLAFYPNLGTAEAFAIVNHRGQHTTVRAHRRLGDDRTNMRIGPVSLEIVEPFREWRLRLEENDWGISFDVRWIDTRRAVFRNIGAGAIVDARPFGGVAGYDSFGVQEGWVRVGEHTIELTRETHLGTRDHHWGTRDGVGGPQMYRGLTPPVSGAFAVFDDWAVWVDHLVSHLGDSRSGPRELAGRRHRLRFEPETKLVLGGEVDLIERNGRTRTIEFERVDDRIAFMRCGMYGGPNGGTPQEDVWQGMYVGDDVVSGETYDTTDPAVRRAICGVDQHAVRFTCEGQVGHGIFEACDTLAHDVARAGRGGISLLT